VEPRKALDGIRVIDLSQFEAGTSCTETLAWLGADVIKVERPEGGEQGRYSSRERPDRDAFYFILLNANKRSVTLNLAEERGKQILRDLIATADVFIENFAPGSIERLGFGPDVVQALNPRIIYARIKGFAPGSPHEPFLVYDSVAQAAGGSVSITGESMDRTPVKPGPNMADTGSGLHCSIGILAALYDREQTGLGQLVEISMQDAVINFCRVAYAQSNRTGLPAKRMGTKNQMMTSAPSGLYHCKPGGPNDYCFIYGSRAGASGNRQWQRLLVAIGRDDLVDDPRFASPELRYEHYEIVDGVINEWTMTKDKHEVMAILGAANVPVGAVFDTVELINDPFLRKHEMFVTVDHPDWGEITIPGSPIRLSRSPVEVKAAPLLGQHTTEVLTGLLGMTDSQVADLKGDGVV
jgi:formyl-CoA transferase